jgi:hypothetical protein
LLVTDFDELKISVRSRREEGRVPPPGHDDNGESAYERSALECAATGRSPNENQVAARALFDALDSANRYAVVYRVHQAKTPEKRAAKIVELVAKRARGETFHPRRNQTPVPNP